MKVTENTEIYSIISFVCFIIIATPLLLVLYWGAEIKSNRTYQGMVRLEPGKLYVKNVQTAEQAPHNQAVYLAEKLNRHVAELAIQSPGNANKIQNSSPQMISKTIESLSPNPPRDLLKRAEARSIRWSPKAGSHGLFMLDYEKRPSADITFGAVDLPWGKEKATFLTERRINQLSYELNKVNKSKTASPDSVPKLVTDALRTRPPLLTPEEGVELIGLCYGLNITYNIDTGLFLANESLPELLRWKRELEK
jgi:hypothetical protein